MLTQFARVLSQNVLLLREAEKAGVRITPLEWADLRRRYLSALDTLKSEMQLSDPTITDESVSADERQKLAALKVEQYFDGLVEGKIRLRPLPAALATLLRERMPYRLFDAGISRAVESAQTLRAKSDSTAPRGPGMQQAPGPPPIPGMGAPPAPQGAAPPVGGQTPQRAP